MRGYYRQPRETSSLFDSDGYFLTGDLGMEDEEGFIHLVGRKKEVIIRSGSNVYLREVEDRLQSHPAICEAMVAGVPDELLGEAICACVLPEEGAIVTSQEIQDWRSVTLADYKGTRPRPVHGRGPDDGDWKGPAGRVVAPHASGARRTKDMKDGRAL